MPAPPVNHPEELVRRLREIKSDLDKLGVERLVLFGSFSRAPETAARDVDLLVKFRAGSKSFDALVDLAEFLESELGRPVDLLTLESLSPDFAPAILGDARDVFVA